MVYIGVSCGGHGVGESVVCIGVSCGGHHRTGTKDLGFHLVSKRQRCLQLRSSAFVEAELIVDVGCHPLLLRSVA